MDGWGKSVSLAADCARGAEEAEAEKCKNITSWHGPGRELRAGRAAATGGVVMTYRGLSAVVWEVLAMPSVGHQRWANRHGCDALDLGAMRHVAAGARCIGCRGGIAARWPQASVGILCLTTADSIQQGWSSAG